MKELGRVCSRKILLFLAVLFVMNLTLFYLCVDPEKEITKTGYELEAYLDSYPKFLKKTEENSKVMGMLGMYQEGFASESISKTAKLYQALQGTQVKAGDNRGIVLLIQYRLTDIFLLAFLFLIVMDFQAERRKGLAYLVRSTVRGRSLLYLQRLGILALATVAGALLFYGGNLLVTLFGFGLDDLSRSLQSLPEFMKCPYSLTIGEYLTRAFFLKMVGSFALAVLFYALVGFLNSVLAYLLSGAIIVGELLAGALITPVSSWNVLRYVNVFTLIQSEAYYQDSVFVDIFGRAREALSSALIFFGGLFLLVLLAGYFIQGRKYVVQSRSGEKIFEFWAKLREKIALQHTLWGWEAYKLFFKQGGLAVIAAVFISHFYLSMQYEYYYPVDMYEKLWYLKFQGELTEQSMARAERSMDLLKKTEALHEKKLEEISNTEPFDSNQYHNITMALATNRQQQQGLLPILEDMRSGMEYTQRTGNQISLVAPHYYDLLLNRDERTRTRASFLTLVSILGILSGIFAFDRQNHMNQVMRTAYRGRKKIVFCKMGLVVLFSALPCGILHFVQLYRVVKVGLEVQYLSQPVQSINFLRGFAFYVPIWGYLVLLFFVRMGMACLLGFVTAGISSRCQDVVTAVGISTFVVVILVVLSGVIPGGEWISPIYWINGTYFR